MSPEGVVICGGGPVGLVLALELTAWQVPVTLVERHPQVGPFPKGRALSTRTMEVLRQLGLEEEVTAAGLPRHETMHFSYGETLTSPGLARISNTPPVGGSPLSPTFTLACSQDRFEEVLRRHVTASPYVDARFGAEVTDADIGDDGATVMVDDGSGATPVVARWLVAADGARSPLRTAAGIERRRFGAGCPNVAILFDADLSEVLAGRTSLVATLSNDRVHAGILLVDGHRRWLCSVVEPDRPALRIDEAWCRAQVHHAVGRPVEVDIVAWRPWDASAANAGRYRHRSMFLVGDAAHVATPYGGFGMNCGIAAAHNLAWKLALNLRHGWSPDLLDTYHDERHPVGERTVEESARRLATALAAHRDGRTRRGEVAGAPSEGLVLGGTYRSAAVLGSTAGAPPDEVARYQPGAHPGGRAPHVWLGDGRSTLDLFGPWFTVLHHPAEPAHVPDDMAGAPVTAVALDDTLDPTGDARAAFGIERGGIVVVRPDGHVTWRSGR